MRVALAAFLSIITTAAAIGQETTAERIDALEKRVRALEAIIGKQRAPDAIIPGDPPRASCAPSSAEAEDKGQMLLKLTKWSASIKEGQYLTHYVISYSLQNNYDKSVKAIIGRINFLDPAGAQILELKLERYLRIGPGREVSYKGFHPIDPSIDSEMKLKDLAQEGVRAQLEIKKIIFGDNTIIDLR